ncbi:MAG: amino acid adenylation domain-containing protein [Pseudomonadales bacterium]|nr:amino acid adenylation domain-containing protein [Pseudomonadales bacterium]
MSVVELLSSLAKKDIRLWLEGENLRFSAPEGAFTPEIRDQIIAAKPEIIEFLKQAQKLKKKGIDKAPRDGAIPVSFSQQRLWLLDQINPNDTTYNIPAAFRIKGQIDPKLLESAFASLVERHESLRTTFAEQEGVPVQVIHAFKGWQLAVEDLSQWPEADRNRELQRQVNQEARTPFDLKSGPLFRARLVILNKAQNEYALIACMHHIISDAWSMDVLVKEMAAFYGAAATGTKPTLDALEIQYADYAIWQRQYMEDDEFQEDLNYWQETLKDAPPVLDIPTDFPRPDLLRSHGATRRFSFPAALAADIDAFCKAQDLTPFMVTLGAWQLLLGRYANSDDVVVGAPVAGRDRHETQELIGFFVNLLLMRVSLAGRPTVNAYYQRIKEMVLGGFNHQEVTIDSLLETMDIERQPGYPPLAQAAFQLLVQDSTGNGAPTLGAGPLEIEVIANENISARMDMTLGVVKTTEGYEASLEYNTDLFTAGTINQLTDQYLFLLSALVSAPEQVIDDISLYDEAFLIEHMGLDSRQVSLAGLNMNQQDMLIDQLAHPQTKQNAYGIYAELPGAIDLDLLQQSIQLVADATPMLRAGVVACDMAAADDAYFVIPNKKATHINKHSLLGRSATEQQLVIDQLMHKAYDIFNDDLTAYHWVELSAEKAVFVIAGHHMIVDGASTFSHMNKVLATYQALREGNAPTLEQDQAFKEYLSWERNHGNSKAILNFWCEQLATTEALHFSKPGTGYHPAEDNNPLRTDDNCIVRFEIPAASSAAIKSLCAEQQLKLPGYFRTLYGVLLRHYCRPEEAFAVFDFYGNRRQINTAAIGCYYQQHPVIFGKDLLSSEATINQWFDATKTASELIKDKRVISLSEQRTLAGLGSIIFMFNFYNFTTREAIEGESVVPYMSAPRVDGGVQFIVRDNNETIELELRYDPRVFVDRQFLLRLNHVSEQIVSAYETGDMLKLTDLEMLSAAEKAQLHQWSLGDAAQATADVSEAMASATIVDLFYQQAQSTPHGVALIEGDRSIDYQTLDQQSNKIAHWLKQQGVQANVRVGLCFERSIDYVVAVWGVLKAGGAYVPMDASYPQKRLAYIIEDSAAPVILAQQKTLAALQSLSTALNQVQVVCVDTDPNIAAQSELPLETRPAPDDQIYAIYTSGSTGKPKGALVTHRGEMNLQQWYLDCLEIDHNSTGLLVSAIGFDLTQKNLFAVLLRGGALVIPQMDVFDEELLIDLIEQHGVNYINCAPSAFYPLVQTCALQAHKPLQSLRYLVLGGEPIQLQLLEKWLASENCHAQLINSYGPTECTDVVSYHCLETMEIGQRLIPIGKPIKGAQLLLLNEANQQLVPGLVGELCVGGVPVGLGYNNRDELTNEVFQENPYGSGKLYRTGDLARFLPNGELEYIGRKDFQIKLRGLRIELGEIESALKALPTVSDGLVILKDEKLIAYVVTESGALTVNWRDQLQQSLPDYMVPAALMALTQWPLTPNGKVDRKALPDAELDVNEYVAPRNDIEAQLVQIWQQVLERNAEEQPIGVFDNLFDIGGNSLLATRILSRARRVFAVDVSVRELFQAPNVAGLAKLIQRCQRIGDIPSLQPQDRTNKIPLSFAQQRLWLLDQLDPENTAYNMPAAVRLSGEVQPQLLERVFAEIIARHEVFRTRFATVDDEPVQVISSNLEFKLPIEDISDKPESERDVRVNNAVIEAANHHFDLANGPLLRAKLIKLSDTETVLLANKHHIISDGWSMGILLQEIATLYNAFLQAKPSPLPALPLQYADFAIWQRSWLQGEVLDRQIDYWKQKLADAPVLELATDFARPTKPDQRGATVEFVLPEVVTTQLEALSQRNNSTLYITLLAAFQTLLYRYTNQRDIVVGSPIANRNWSELESIIGFFVNTLAFRNQLDPQQSFQEFLYQVEQTALEAYDHQDIPFERLVDELGVERSLTHTPVFQVLFTYQNIGGPTELELPGLKLSPIEAESNDAKFDLMLNMGVNNGRLSGVFAYRQALYKEQTIRNLVRHFEVLLASIAENPQSTLSQLPMLSPEEVATQLQDWNQTAVAYDKQATLHTLIDQQCQSSPEAIAIKWGANQLTYKQLQSQACLIADALIAGGVQADDKVGLCFDRHLALMPAILGILKAGATYVPLDASYPEGRIRYIVEDAQITMVLSRSQLIDSLPQGDWNYLAVDDLDLAAAVTNPMAAVQPDPERLLYMIYTSGSTGRPKGTGAFHRAEVNLQQWYCRDYGLNNADNILLMSALGFDLTQKNLFAPLLKGATLVIPDFQEFDPQLLIDTIHHYQVTWINCAPSAFYPLTDEQQQWHKLASLKHLFLGGEPISLARLKPWLNFSGCKLINSYGPTECTDITTVHKVDLVADSHQAVLPIGRPIDNVRTYVLGDGNELMPIGGVGELCIGGDSVGPGYLNNQALTDEVFFQNPYSDVSDTLYRTGDLVRYRDNGLIEYIGRRDHQIKLRGFRIEVEEIKAVLNEYEGVTDSFVAVEKNQAGELLFAWVVGATDSTSAEAESAWLNNLKAYAANLLPSHMIPGVWHVLARFPLTPNGKVDRKALPKEANLSNDSRSPETPTEQSVAKVWQQVLGVEQVGADQDFFQLGGHSLLATQVISRLKKQFQIEIPLRRLFESPTVEHIARIIDELLADGDQSQVPPLVTIERNGANPLPLSFVQQQLWLLDQLDPGSAAYNMPVLLELTGDLDVAALNGAMSVVVERHETLRSNFVVVADEPVVKIHEPSPWTVNRIDISDQTSEQQQQIINQTIDQETQRGFDLASDVLMRTTLLQCHKNDEPQRWIFIAVIHHIISDGWSMEVLVQEIATAYMALRSGQIHSGEIPSGQAPANETLGLKPLAFQYVDYAAWQRAWLQGDELQKQIAYWRGQLDNEFSVLDLPTDFPRPAVQTINGASLSHTLNSRLIEGLAGIAKHEGATLFMALLAAFELLLHRYSGQQGINIGIPIAGRVREEVEPMIGMFINTAVISADFSNVNSYRDLLIQVKEKSLGAYSHQALPFEKIVEELKPKRDLSRTPYFQVFFNLLNLPASNDDVAGLSIKPMFGPDHEVHAKFDLNLYAKETAEGVQLQMVYNTDLFAQASITSLLTQFETLLTHIVQSPEKALLEYVLSRHEDDVRPDPTVELPLKDWPHPLYNLCQLAASQPDQVAVSDSRMALTYQQLDNASASLATQLAAQGVQRGDVVAVYAQRNAAVVVSLLGVLRLGAVFTIFDAAYPLERLRQYQSLSAPRLIIDTVAQQGASHQIVESLGGNKETVDSLSVITLGPKQLEDLAADSNTTAIANHYTGISTDAAAYIAYTSGTTGEPKAIKGSLAPVMHFVDWYKNECQLSTTDRFSMLSGLAHDPLLRDIFTPLTLGASLVIPDAAWFADPQSLVTWLAEQQVTVMHLTPAMSQLLTSVYPWQGEDPVPAELQFSHLRYAVFGGDKLTAHAVQAISAFSDATCVNFYGATETPQAMAYQRVADMSDCHPNQWVAIGQGIDASQLLVINEKGRLADIGEVGEIVIRSPYLSHGYLQQTEDSPFKENPFTEFDAIGSSDVSSDRVYFSGDKGRYLPDGSVHFLGRIDQQIKIRGYRVEPSEIQHQLNLFTGVQTSLVVEGVDARGDVCLNAYLVLADSSAELDRDGLRSSLMARLPDYMVPSSYTLIDAIPLTPNGKINRAELPQPDSQISEQTYVAPETAVEKEIAEIWQLILKIDQVGINDDFFALGGHSLLATQIVSRVREKYNVEFPLRALFQSSTVKGMADYIETTLWARGDAPAAESAEDDDDMEEFEI